GGDSEEVTPVPIPNTEVKLFSADGSEGLPLVRAGRRRAKTEHGARKGFMFFCVPRGSDNMEPVDWIKMSNRAILVGIRAIPGPVRAIPLPIRAITPLFRAIPRNSCTFHSISNLPF